MHDSAAPSLDDVCIGRSVRYVMPHPVQFDGNTPIDGPLPEQWDECGTAWPAQVLALMDGRPDGRLLLLVRTLSGLFRTIAPYDERRARWTWHLADDADTERSLP